jgi:AraC-like DNA-binding protein
MHKNDLFFHIARDAGFEFVFASGNALRYPTHTHVSVYTITIVRKGMVRLHRRETVNTYHAGSMYVVAPHEPHNPEYSDDFDMVSLCVNKNHFQNMNNHELAVLAARYSIPLANDGFLLPTDVQSIKHGVDYIYQLRNARNIQDQETCPDSLLLEIGADMSPYRFIRYFKRKTGLTPHQYIIQRRIREAKRMLVSNVSIVDVAALSGFYDQSHLNRWFNKTIGITPHHYRNSCFFMDAE